MTFIGASKLEHPFPTKGSPDAVVETSIVRARQVLLIVARVEMVGDVEHLDADRGVMAKQAQALADLQVERQERGIAPSLVAGPHEVPVLVDRRQRKSGPEVEQREHGEAPRQADVAPEQ